VYSERGEGCGGVNDESRDNKKNLGKGHEYGGALGLPEPEACSHDDDDYEGQ
jgi:hypothetical protein